MHISRTRFAKQIVTEFIPPKNKRSKKVLIICHGMPSVPKKNKVMEFFSEQGYWVFFPRYRGSWESGGQFLKKSPHLDVLDVIDGIPKGFTDYWTDKKYKFKPTKINLLGWSFGGPAVILASRDKRVNKVVALCPVVDWTDDSKIEPLEWLGKFTKNAFGNAYRFKQSDWDKLLKGKFYNPIKHAADIDGSKLFLVHAKDDELVPYRSVKKFSEITKASLWTLRTGGHLSSLLVTKARFSKPVLKFFNS